MNYFNGLDFYRLSAKTEDCPPEDLPEIVMAGRSNVGKSSLINALACRKGLARVSSTPGKTRHIIYYLKKDYVYLTDLPGYGYAQSSKAEKARFSGLVDNYLTLGRNFALILVLLDIRHEPSAHDRHMLEFLEASGYPYAVVLTKSDKLSRMQMLNKMRDFKLAGVEKVFPVSALKRNGIDELAEFLDSCIRNHETS